MESNLPKWCCPFCGTDVGYLGNWLAKWFGTQIHNCEEMRKLNNQTDEQKRVLVVLDRIRQQVEDDPDNAIMYAEILEEGLDLLLGEDAFGTEGQCDPRGDMRDDKYSMFTNIDGVDNV